MTSENLGFFIFSQMAIGIYGAKIFTSYFIEITSEF